MCGTIVPGCRGLAAAHPGYAAGAARRRQRTYVRAHSSSLSGSALTVPRTARLFGSSAASAFFNATSAFFSATSAAHLGAGHVGHAEGVAPQAIDQGAVVDGGGFGAFARWPVSTLARGSHRIVAWFRRARHFAYARCSRPTIRRANAWVRHALTVSVQSSIDRFVIGAVGFACHDRRPF